MEASPYDLIYSAPGVISKESRRHKERSHCVPHPFRVLCGRMGGLTSLPAELPQPSQKARKAGPPVLLGQPHTKFAGSSKNASHRSLVIRVEALPKSTHFADETKVLQPSLS